MILTTQKEFAMAVAKYKKGLETQMKILNTAKTLFFEKGYFATSIKEICQIVGITSGTFAYYFNVKESLIDAVYSDLLLKCTMHVTSKVERRMNSLEKNCYISYLYYTAIFENEQTIRFHEEILAQESPSIYTHNVVYRFFDQIVKDFHLNMSKQELDYISTFEYGARRELTWQFIKDNGNGDILDLVDFMIIMRGRLYKIDESIIRGYIQNARDFSELFDFSKLHLLI